MKEFKFTINGNDYAVDVIDFEDNIARLEVNGTPFEVEVHKKVKTSKTPRVIAPAPKSPSKPVIDKRERGDAHPVTAPLPGNILEVKVKPGDIIEKGQLMMVMEAMKMENQVLADRQGVIESIPVMQGDSVLQGDTLVYII
ncbi:MAG TPA: biotin/lipoyl-containing protein [Bacteroidales bacterium]|nr:biotin/lipoyl-containing protein [Bacteroidales bacterium]